MNLENFVLIYYRKYYNLQKYYFSYFNFRILFFLISFIDLNINFFNLLFIIIFKHLILTLNIANVLLCSKNLGYY
jgi:hypothetical protein